MLYFSPLPLSIINLKNMNKEEMVRKIQYTILDCIFDADLAQLSYMAVELRKNVKIGDLLGDYS